MHSSPATSLGKDRFLIGTMWNLVDREGQQVIHVCCVISIIDPPNFSGVHPAKMDPSVPRFHLVNDPTPTGFANHDEQTSRNLPGLLQDLTFFVLDIMTRPVFFLASSAAVVNSCGASCTVWRTFAGFKNQICRFQTHCAYLVT